MAGEIIPEPKYFPGAVVICVVSAQAPTPSFVSPPSPPQFNIICTRIHSVLWDGGDVKRWVYRLKGYRKLGLVGEAALCTLHEWERRQWEWSGCISP